MATFIYAPDIRVHIESSDSRIGIVDVSGDIANWTMDRRSNAVSSFNFMLQNTQRKYDGAFRPGDRITVELKRLTWVRVFTGTLNNSPIFSAWPRALPMSASCTLKRLQFWPWDPTTVAANTLIEKWVTGNSGDTNAAGDGGLSNLAVEAIAGVTNNTWPKEKIHFGKVPNQWYKWAEEVETLIAQESTMAAVLGGTATINGQKVVGTISLQPGNYAGVLLNSDQINNATSIYAIILSRSETPTTQLQDQAARIAIMTVMTESTLQNLSSGDRDSVGLFQQRPSQGWGTAAECQDITHATNAFLDHLFKVSNWSTIDAGAAAQAVQRSAPDAYDTYTNFANVLVAAMRAQYNKQIKTTPGSTSQGLASALPNLDTIKKATGDNIAKVAWDLVKTRPPGYILYSETGVSDQASSDPTVLDCSSLVQWVYFHATGARLNYRTTYDQYPVMQHIPIELAKYIRGAAIFAYPSAQGPGHVGISLGNNTHVAAHDAYSNRALDVTAGDVIDSGFYMGALLPGVDYSNAATTLAAATQLKGIIGGATGVSTVAIGDISDPSVTTAGSTTTNPGNSAFEQLVFAITNAPAATSVFAGARELINNQFFLPWVQNVVNSSMRSFCSAPNGDFIAWFPDYFNVWKTAAVMNIEPIELQDFTVDWSDQQIVTHEFVIGAITSILDNVSGGVQNNSDSSYAGTVAMLQTRGIATMDFPGIFKAIYGKPATQKFVTDYLTRFGARPNVDQMGNIRAGAQEFYMALWNFMYYWSSQFTATVPMTFMPELYPGMILKIPAYDFQAYVTEVNHSGSYGANGGFTTTATIIAPARTSNATDLFGMLPLAGSTNG